MSWQQYVDSSMLGSEKVQAGAILGHDGTVWAQSPNFKISPQEFPRLFQAFKDSSDILANGLHLGGDKFIPHRVDDRSIYARKMTSAGKTSNDNEPILGIIAVKTQQTILIGEYNASTQAGETADVIERLGSYLIELNY